MKPYTNYCENIEGSAWAQFCEAMKQDFVVKGALMPDAHMGYTLPIGAVVACKNYVVPSYVGYDIGCGMSAIKLSFVTPEEIIAKQDTIFQRIYQKVPVGFAKNKKGVALPNRLYDLKHTHIATELLPLAEMQLGTLGGGNHFIEIGVDGDNDVWIIVHSGSRGFGHKIATHYMKEASVDRTRLMAEFNASHKDMRKHCTATKYIDARASFVENKVSKAKAAEGHFGFDADSDTGRKYIADATFAQEFALENRKLMIERVMEVLATTLGHPCQDYRTMGNLINRNHNHVVQRLIDGENCYIHRKGATHAEEGMLGVIPGNMRDGSFIVVGKGNPDALFSSSHGAGRVLGRKAAKAQLELDDFKATMVNVKAKVSGDTIDESPMAYKNIYDVMAAQTELVEIIYHVRPLINIKG